MSIRNMQLQVGTLERQAGNVSQDSSGGSRRVWDPVSGAVNIPLSVQIASAGTQMRYMQRNLVVTAQIHLDFDVAAQVGDRFTVGEDMYHVHGYNPLQTGHRKVFTCDCEQLPRGKS